MAKPVKKKLIEVVWLDPETDGGWRDGDHDEPMDRIYAYGLLVSKTKDRVPLAAGYDPAKDSYSDLMRFPIGCVLKITTILTMEYEQ